MKKLALAGLTVVFCLSGISSTMAKPTKNVDGYHHRTRLTYYCEVVNPKSPACPKFIQARKNYIQAKKELRSDIRNYCKQNPKDNFCQPRHRKHHPKRKGQGK